MACGKRTSYKLFLLVLTTLLSIISFTHKATAETEFISSENTSCHPEAGNLLRLYQTIFNRTPDKDGANYWLEKLDEGLTLKSISYWMFQSPEYKAKYKGLDNKQFIVKVYRNVLKRKPDTGGYNYWLNKLNRGLDRSELVLLFSNSKEFRTHFPYTKNSFCAFVDKHGGGKSMAPGVVYQQRGRAHIAFIDLENRVQRTFVTPENSSLENTAAFAKRNKLTVAMNGNWFGDNGWLDGFAVSNKNVYGGSLNTDINQSGDHAYTSLFGFSADHKVIAPEWHGYTSKTVNPKIVSAISGHPTLVHGSRLASAYQFELGPRSSDPTIRTANARSAVGVTYDNKKLIMVAVEGSPGVGYTALELAQLMQGLGSHYAVMLDGGGSSALAINGTDVSKNQVRIVKVNFGLRTGNYYE